MDTAHWHQIQAVSRKANHLGLHLTTIHRLNQASSANGSLTTDSLDGQTDHAGQSALDHQGYGDSRTMTIALEALNPDGLAPRVGEFTGTDHSTLHISKVSKGLDMKGDSEFGLALEVGAFLNATKDMPLSHW
jgi:hypothetical protein